MHLSTDLYKNIHKITVSVGEEFESYDFIDSKEGKGCVNIFNKKTFEAITQELDTIKDLTEYLKEREKLLSINAEIKPNCSEQDLLACYLMNNRKFSKALQDSFENESKKLINKWEEYKINRSVFFKKLADEKSYFIDELIENDVLKLPDGELLAAELMTLSRFERRIIATNLYEVSEKYSDKKDFLVRRFSNYNGVGFLFICYPLESTQNEIDELIQWALPIYSYRHDVHKIVLLAASVKLKQWKFGLFQQNPLTVENKKQLDTVIDKLGWFKDEKAIDLLINEYPDK